MQFGLVNVFLPQINPKPYVSPSIPKVIRVVLTTFFCLNNRIRMPLTIALTLSEYMCANKFAIQHPGMLLRHIRKTLEPGVHTLENYCGEK